MYNVAILGFGVVGGGVARLLTENKKETALLSGEEIAIKAILDLRDFPDSPFGKLVVHDYERIVSDPEIDCIIEVMGGSHPAYEYTVAALKAGKSVITSNKEVVANFGDEFLRLAQENGACYRFEASVGGGIPVISPIISCIRQNRISEVRGILNGTTNYILTKMFTYGDSFENSLLDAQAKGYAERNPDADILGTDASRKIAILGALISGRLTPVDKIHTEGITGIRRADVEAAGRIGCSIKLLGRCINKEGESFIMVAPFMIPADEPLYSVKGVYNAVEVIGEPIESAMFYGPGAGAGPTASAIVGDLMQIILSGRATAMPTMLKTVEGLSDFSEFVSKRYIAFDQSVSLADAEAVFGKVTVIDAEGELAFVTEPMSEAECDAAVSALEAKGAKPLSKIRLLK